MISNENVGHHQCNNYMLTSQKIVGTLETVATVQTVRSPNSPSSNFSTSFHSKQYYSNSIKELFIAAPIKEQHQLGNETIAVEIEKKTEQWLGATLHSTGENGNVLVSLGVNTFNNALYMPCTASHV